MRRESSVPRGLVVADRGPAEVTARELAFTDAQARADQYAGLGVLRLGGLLDLSEVSRDVGGPVRAAMSSRAPTASMPVEAGKFELTAHVLATWQLTD
ncbi:MAG TPA: SIMPL domain-containing protein [Mycobacteriales bacterium]|nr:SIMPL domain-containing protein [Mycobacteriales bacterium]